MDSGIRLKENKNIGKQITGVPLTPSALTPYLHDQTIKKIEQFRFNHSEKQKTIRNKADCFYKVKSPDCAVFYDPLF
ncbi:hypothetical protein J1TS3_12400 [Siminovitchia fordii]|uniref:Uncharacterized protein n=1 Tax=Siminovitchia fordii TaxID=254759 RepID=A0ABQ4K586_9BACI|nr:hypothetical protein J1TS3_12400 [Siminovitchia fordii]